MYINIKAMLLLLIVFTRDAKGVDAYIFYFAAGGTYLKSRSQKLDEKSNAIIPEKCLKICLQFFKKP